MKDKQHQFPKDWREKIEKSGKLFEQEIASIVQKSGFGYVTPNDAFVDIESGESRELDVFAISGRKIGRKDHFLFPILLIAVKKIRAVCFMRDELMTKYTLGDIHFSGIPKTIYVKNDQADLTEFLKLEKIHHFYRYKKVSSQFWTPIASNESKEDHFFKSLILPLVKSVISNINEHEKDWDFDPEGEPINLQMYYPIIVVEELWECNLTKAGSRYKKVPRVGFVSRHASEKVSGTYLIDICDKNGFKALLKTINSEIEQLVKIIKKKISIIENSALVEAKKKIDKKG